MLLSKIKYLLFSALLMALWACQPAGGNYPGSEYMPDMAHSIAYEANYYNFYDLNTWGTEDEYYKYASPRKAVKGTIPRGYSGRLTTGRVKSDLTYKPNGYVPYYYADNDNERIRATNSIINNPYLITNSGINRGKELYDIYCGICHGDKGDGLGFLVREADPSKRDEGGKYLAQPANLLLDQFVSGSNGQLYHAIMYGKNMMGGYQDKLSYKERWEVVHYIRSLQAQSLGLVYSGSENTLNDVDTPYAVWLEEQKALQSQQPNHNTGSSIINNESHH